MNFRSKIFSGYLLLSLFFSGGLVLCLHPLNPIERSFERLSAENLPVLNLVQSIRILGSLLHAEMLDIAYLLSLDETPEVQKAIHFEILESDHTRQQLLKDVEEYRRLVELYFPEESLYIPLLKVQVDQLSRIGDELKNRSAGQSAAVSLQKTLEIKELEKRFLETTDQIIRDEVREIHLRRERVHEAVAEARSWVGMTFIICLGSALLIAFVMARRISQPVSQLVAAVEKYSAKRDNLPLEFESNDEIGQLAEMFNRLKHQVEEPNQKTGEALDQCRPASNDTRGSVDSQDH